MKLATTTGDYNFLNDINGAVKKIHQAGFRYIDLSIYSKYESDFFMQDNWKAEVINLKNKADSLGMKFVQAHSPSFRTMMSSEGYESAMAKTLRSIEVCGMLGIPNTVVHSLFGADGEGKEKFFEKNIEFYKSLLPVAEQSNVDILIENTTKANVQNSYFFFTGEDMKEFIREINHPNLHACWDTGHANVENHQYEDIMALGEDLCAVHINDNRGLKDEHTMPYLGTMSLDEVMCGLIDSGYKGYFTFECGMTVITGKRTWPYPKRLWEKSEKLLYAPQFICDELEKLLYKTGKYILETYDCFEE